MTGQASAELAAFVIGGASQWARAHKGWPEWAYTASIIIAGAGLTIYVGLEPHLLIGHEWREAWGQVFYTIILGFGGTQVISTGSNLLDSMRRMRNPESTASAAIPVTNSQGAPQPEGSPESKQ